MASNEVLIPHRFTPRGYQMGLFKAREAGMTRMLCVWHRRAGKDKALVNLCAREAFQRVGAYYYYFPTAVWARKAIWDGMDKDGMKFMDHFPADVVAGVKDREMQVEFVNGSIFQIIGTDSLDVVGVNPVGCVFSEYSLQNPKAWQYVTPILLENGGWAAFNFTPRGKNHAHALYTMAKKNPRWYCELLTIRDTGAISDADVEQEIAEGNCSKELAQQEYYCSFEFGMEGSIFGNYMREAAGEGRISEQVAYDPELPVYTFWDLGVSDALVTWFGQASEDGQRMTMVDYSEEHNKGLDWAKGMLDERKERKGYVYAGHVAPHDVAKREQTTGVSVVSTAEKLGIRFETVPRTASVEADIELVRRMLPRFQFVEEECSIGIGRLSDYKRDERTGKPMTSGADSPSHGVDGFRTACRAIDLGIVKHLQRGWRMRREGIAERRQMETGTLGFYNPIARENMIERRIPT